LINIDKFECQIKNIHYQIQEDWKIIQNKLESKIIQKYAHDGQMYTIFIFCKKVYIINIIKFKLFILLIMLYICLYIKIIFLIMDSFYA